MSINYRCRCGQEIVLRPKESMYFAGAILLALSLLNTALVGFVWWELKSSQQDDPQQASNSIHGPLSPQQAIELAKIQIENEGLKEMLAKRLFNESATATQGANRNAPTKSRHSQKPSIDSQEMYSAQLPNNELASTASHEDSNSETQVARTNRKADFREVQASAKLKSENQNANMAKPKLFSLRKPANLTGMQLLSLLESENIESADRLKAVLATLLWGSHELSKRATEKLNTQEISKISMLVDNNQHLRTLGKVEEVEIKLGDMPTEDAKYWQGFARAWDSFWKSRNTYINSEWAPWKDAAVLKESDFVFLIDLSESMSAEIQQTRALFELLLPLLQQDGLRFGWIAYRDELVDRFDLTADVDSFLSSMGRWQCKEGGDVPEGVDRAFFEALRFESLKWGQSSLRKILVLGDAPAPFERIEALLSLIESAHLSPEAYEVSCLGIGREAQFDTVPSFAEMAKAGGGANIFVREGQDLAISWWKLLTGDFLLSKRAMPWRPQLSSTKP